jgi:hypothetical protein
MMPVNLSEFCVSLRAACQRMFMGTGDTERTVGAALRGRPRVEIVFAESETVDS